MNVKINDLNWQILKVSSDDVNLLDGKNKCYGICYYTEQIIYIDKSLEINKLYRTLKHELTHAFIYCYLLKMNCKFDEEELCEFVAIYAEKIINIATDFINTEVINNE